MEQPPTAALPPGLDAHLLPAHQVSAFHRPVRSLVRRSPVTCSTDTAVADAARMMQRQGVGSILVLDAGHRLAGIITDRDLRCRVVAAGVPTTEAAGRIMSAPVCTLSADAPAIEGLLEMLRRGIRHLPLLTAALPPGASARVDQVVGVVSSTDFLSLRDSHPLALLRDIERQEAMAGLAQTAKRTALVIVTLLDAGVPVTDITRVMTELNDALVRRVLALSEAALFADGHGEPPAAYCWLALGSEGRREQTLRTDQDNALVYQPADGLPAGAVEDYFRLLAERAVDGLIQCGFPRCPANIMATNADWRQPLTTWQDYFSRWIRTPTPENLLQAAIFLDLRAVWGHTGLAWKLWDHIRTEVAGWRSFLRHLAAAAVSGRPPVGWFGRIATPWWGPDSGLLDVKEQGLLFVVSGLRVHALDLGLNQTNTLERLQAVAAAGHITHSQVEELSAAYEVFTRLRLRRQVADLQAGRQPGNRIPVAGLNRVERAELAAALRAVVELQDGLKQRFVTDALVG